MVKDRPMWVDIGMAIAVAVFIAIVLFFRSADYAELLMVTYAAAMVVWAFIAESAAIRFEEAPVKEPARQPTGKPLPH
jgi:hypothetical protein